MNTTIKKAFNDRINNVTKEKKDLIRCLALVVPLVAGLSENVYVNPIGVSEFWFYVNNRSDLMVLMTLSDQWNKETQVATIDYTSFIDGLYVRIRAEDGALPDTCRLVKKQVTIPAVPEHVEERLVVECNTP